MKITSTYTRPNKTVTFFSLPSFNAHLASTYIATNKLVVESSVTNLTRVVELTGAEADIDTLSADPVVVEYKEARDAYNEAHGITLVQTQDA